MAVFSDPKAFGSRLTGFNKPPVGNFELNTDHPLNNYLRSAFYFGIRDSGTNANEDWKTNRIYSMAGTLPSNVAFGVDSDGTHLDCTTTGTNGVNYGEIELADETFDNMGEITILCGFKRTGDQDFGYGRLICKSNGSSGDEWGATLNSNGGGRYLRWRIKGNSMTGGTALTDNVYYDAAFTYKNGDRSIYLDGEVDNNDSVTLGTSLSDAYPTSLFANPTSSSRAMTGKMYYCIVFDKVLTQEEIQSFIRDRYQLLRPTAKIYSFTDEGAAPTGGPVAGSFGLLGVGI